jgi:UDP-N-acetyl-D-mannosaminuronic acid dehydrogenase
VIETEKRVSVIGLGRVGLPLALCFADRGLCVLGVDHDPAVLETVRAGRMPFAEAGTQELLDRVSQTGRLELSERAADAAQADDIVITIGTPSFTHLESDLRQVRAAVEDVLPHLRPAHAVILRSTIAPGTTEFVAGYLEKRRGLRIGEDVFVAHAPERIAAGRFLDEISTLPCIIGGVGDASTERAASLFSVFDGPIVRTTSVHAELAKIWTNILRYTTFALPNLLMMDCESYGANVFEVIELINRDYPRGGIAMPGLTAGTCLRKDFVFSEERLGAPGMLLAVSRVNEAVPLFLVEGVKRRIGSLAARKVAVLGLTFKRDTDDERDSLSHKLVRLLERELADVAVCDPHAPSPTQPFEQAVQDADVVIVATNHSEFGRREAFTEIVSRAAEDCLLVDPWNALGTSQVFVSGVEAAAIAGRVTVGGGDPVAPAGPSRSAGRVLVTGGAGMIGSAVVRRLLRDPRWEVRIADHRPAAAWTHGDCELHTADLRDPSAARAALAGCSHVIHLAAIVGGIANFHKLPLSLTSVNNALTGALVQAALDEGVERFVYVSSSMVFERASEFPTTEAHLLDCPTPRSAYGFSKLAGEVYTRAAHDQHGLRYTICRPFNAYGPGELPDPDEPGIAHAVPDLIAKALAGQRPLQIFGSGRQTRTLTHVDDIADGLVTAMASPAGENEDFNISAAEELTVAEIARAVWDACGHDPATFELAQLPSFPVDVQRRWPSVEKARRLLGWEARITLRDGIAQTVAWLRDEQPEPSIRIAAPGQSV